MISLSVWLKDSLPRTPGANRKVVLREFRLCAREFFAQSRTWRETLLPMDLIANQADYLPIASDTTNSEVVAVEAVEVNGFPMKPVAGKPWGPATGTSARAWYTKDPPEITLHPTPRDNKPDALVCHVSLIPKIDAQELPDWIFQRYYDALFDGTMGRLYSQPAKAYTNLTGAQYHLNRFRTFIQQASGEAKQGHVNAQNWAFPRFGK